MFRSIFEGVRSYAFCSAPEARLVASRFDISKCSQDVVGIGVDPPQAPDVEEFQILRGIERPYLLYAGRIDAGKGCDEMLRFYARAAIGEHWDQPTPEQLLAVAGQLGDNAASSTTRRL